jgi:hypothetical protein
MKKKLIGILVCMLVFGAFAPVVSSTNFTVGLALDNELSDNGDKLDQCQYSVMIVPDWYDAIDFPDDISGFPVTGRILVSQSFVPTLPILTKVHILLCRMDPNNGEPFFDILVSIRSKLDGPDLTSVKIIPDEIPEDGYNRIEADFKDIAVRPGEQYFIVISALNAPMFDYWPDHPAYLWANGVNTEYTQGELLYKFIDGKEWGPYGNVDLDTVFETYGRD